MALFHRKVAPASALRAQDIRPPKEVSDHYLGELAAAHSAQLATLDAGIKHPAAWLIA